MKVIAVPKTMDNDVHNTEYCIGFSTAITRATDAIERQWTTVGSHERIGIFRVFGRDAGYTALYTAYVTSIRCCIPEYKVNLEKLIDLLIDRQEEQSQQLLAGGAFRRRAWEGYKVQEYGEPDAFGHRKKASVAEDAERRKSSSDRRRDRRQRSDLRSAQRRAGLHRQTGRLHLRHHGVRCVLAGQERLDGRDQRRPLRMVPIPDPKLGPRKVDVATMYNTERYRPNYETRPACRFSSHVARRGRLHCPREARMKTNSALRVLAVAVMGMPLSSVLALDPPPHEICEWEHSHTGCRWNVSRCGRGR